MAEKILVVNDEEPVRELIGMILQKHGYQVIEAVDGFKGIEKAISELPDLILLDVMMPGMDGYETCVKLKLEPKTKEIPIIFLSSLSAAKDKIKGLQLGGVDFVTRVNDQAELIARVQTHLKIRSLTLTLIQRNEELVQKQKYLDEDLEAAAEIQRSLLPKNKAIIPNFDIAWECAPCDLVGGDIFNILILDDEHIVIYMIDVSGHGVPSAMVTVSVSQHLHEAVQAKSQRLFQPSAVLKTLDRLFPMERFNKFMTIFYMIINAKTGTLKYSNAGHPPPILIHQNSRYNLLTQGGSVVGINEGLPFKDGELVLKAGDKIFLYTDGIIEHQNAQEQFFTSERLFKLIESNKTKSTNEICNLVIKSVDEFGQGIHPADDISILGLEYKGT
jgi:sigma-B regulation protein RsbU (phosphoserine phosphatase)